MHMCMYVFKCVYVNHLCLCACNLGIDIFVCARVCVCMTGSNNDQWASGMSQWEGW